MRSYILVYSYRDFYEYCVKHGLKDAIYINPDGGNLRGLNKGQHEIIVIYDWHYSRKWSEQEEISKRPKYFEKERGVKVKYEIT